MPKMLRVALLVESSHSFGRKLLQGIAGYAHAFGPWEFFQRERSIDDTMPGELRDWKPDGVIARISTRRLDVQLKRLDVPVVNLYERSIVSHDFRVVVNNEAIIQMAAGHLLECGLTRLGFVGLGRAKFSEDRRGHFLRYVAAHGQTPLVFLPPIKDSRKSSLNTKKFSGAGRRDAGLAEIEAQALRQSPALGCWLDALPKPVGIVACNDICAQWVLSVCTRRGLKVPDDVAVVGIDNDEVCCGLCTPSLTSVDPNALQVGYEAAAMLHRILSGKCRSPQTTIVEPNNLIRRGSSDVLAFADRELAEIVGYVRQNACRGLSVGQVARRAKMSQATLYRYFRDNLGRSPGGEIARVRVNRIKELLRGTDLGLKQIARLAGFKREETMYRLFKRATGQTPREFRQDNKNYR